MGFFCSTPPVLHRKNAYLAIPYSHPDPDVRQARFELACDWSAWLIERGCNVFSPISHSHYISQRMGNANDSDFWVDMDLTFLGLWAEVLILVCESGVWKSDGVARELEEATLLGIPVIYACVPFVEEGYRRMVALEKAMYGHMWE